MTEVHATAMTGRIWVTDRKRPWRKWAALGMLLLLPSGTLAQEYYGRFLTGLSGSFTEQEDHRPKFKLSETFKFEDPNRVVWEVPADTEVDGASIPQFLWLFAAPFSGDYLWASVVHDYYCDTKSKTEHDTHRNFYYGMLAQGVDRTQADFMYWAVETFGPTWTLEAPGEQLDLTDPVVLAAAKSKAAAVARTLNWSNGRYLDISSSGLVENSPEAIAESARFYRGELNSGNFLNSPDEMGVLGFWTENIASSQWDSAFEPQAAMAMEDLDIGTVVTSTTSLRVNPTTDADLAAPWLAIDELAGKLP